MNTFSVFMLVGLGLTNGLGLGLGAAPMAQLARYMQNADAVSFNPDPKP